MAFADIVCMNIPKNKNQNKKQTLCKEKVNIWGKIGFLSELEHLLSI